MADYEEKFIVINTKRFEELKNVLDCGEFGDKEPHCIQNFLDALTLFRETYEANIGEIEQKYFCVNQDEPYANRILAEILKGEDFKKLKEASDKNERRLSKIGR